MTDHQARWRLADPMLEPSEGWSEWIPTDEHFTLTALPVGQAIQFQAQLVNRSGSSVPNRHDRRAARKANR